MSGASRLLLLVTLAAWPLQSLDDAVAGWMRSHQEPGARRAMQFASDKARVALIAGAAYGALSGAGGRALLAETLVALLPVNLAVEGL